MKNNWQEVAERIKNKTATPEEQQVFEEKCAEYQWFQEYLFDEDWPDFLSDQESIKEDALFYKKIKNQTRNKLLRLILFILVSLFVLGGLGIWGFHKWEEYYYFDATTTMPESKIPDLMTYELLYDELFFPDFQLRSGQIKEIGSAEYQIHYQYQKRYQETSQSLEHRYQIVRNGFQHLGEMNPAFTQSTYPMFLAAYESESMREMAKTLQEKNLEKITGLPQSSSVYGFLTFKEPLSMTQIFEQFGLSGWLSTEEASIHWLSVKNKATFQDQNQASMRMMGMDMGEGGLSFQFENSAYIKLNQRYPKLFPQAFVNSKPADTPEDYEQHFQSLLNYLIDQAAMLNYVSLQLNGAKEEFEAALQYIQTNGVKIDGLYFSAGRDKFLELAQNPFVLTTEVFETTLFSQRY